jgi:hypothetical protein
MLAFLMLLVGTCFWASPKQIPDLSGDRVETMQGRIVSYDWVLHETTANDDFVFKLVGPLNSQPKYVRVMDGPVLGWDAPNRSRDVALDRWAFGGKGAVWSLTLRSPRTADERSRCSSPGRQLQVRGRQRSWRDTSTTNRFVWDSPRAAVFVCSQYGLQRRVHACDNVAKSRLSLSADEASVHLSQDTKSPRQGISAS